jgi:hypothetical protein
MSNPKEKAEELCFKFQGDFNLNWTMSKRCAMIAVDLVLSNRLFWKEDYNYWNDVKEEINKL